MSEPTSPAPVLLKDTKRNTPWWKRPSTFALAIGFGSGVVSELPRWVENVLPFVREDWKPWFRIAAYTCISLGVVFVRMGVTNSNKTMEQGFAKTEEVLGIQPPAPETTGDVLARVQARREAAEREERESEP